MFQPIGLIWGIVTLGIRNSDPCLSSVAELYGRHLLGYRRPVGHYSKASPLTAACCIKRQFGHSLLNVSSGR